RVIISGAPLARRPARRGDGSRPEKGGGAAEGVAAPPSRPARSLMWLRRWGAPRGRPPVRAVPVTFGTRRGGPERPADGTWDGSSAVARSGTARDRGSLCWGSRDHRGPEGGGAPMADLIYSAITSLDGYVADEEGNFDWAAPDEDVHAYVNDLERPIGTYLYGRRMYEVMTYWETAHTVPDQTPSVLDYADLWQAADKV